MLALARKVNESIMLGNDIEITLLEIKGDQVKIGISAPKSVPIYRKEIYLQFRFTARRSICRSRRRINRLPDRKLMWRH